MIILYILLLVLASVLIYHITCYYTLLFRFARFYKHITSLKHNFMLYNARKQVLARKNYSYDNIFPFRFETDEVVIKSDVSQKELIGLLYEEIDKLDKIIPKLPEIAFEEDKKHFYTLRRLIRTEKLANENTTF